MLEISESALREVEEALERYKVEVRESGVAPNTEQTYIPNAEQFVRWLKGEFQPGSQVRLKGS